MSQPDHLQGSFEYLTPEKYEHILRYLEDQTNLIQLVPTSAPPTPPEASLSPVLTPTPKPNIEPTVPVQMEALVYNDARALYNMFALPFARSSESAEFLSISQKSQGVDQLQKDALPKPGIIGTAAKRLGQGPKPKGEPVELPQNYATYCKEVIARSKPSFSFQAFDLEGRLVEERSLYRRPRHPKRSQAEMAGRNLQPFKGSRMKEKKLPKYFSKRLSDHRISLPVLGRANPFERPGSWVEKLHFSEKGFLREAPPQPELATRLTAAPIVRGIEREPTSFPSPGSKSRFFTALSPCFISTDAQDRGGKPAVYKSPRHSADASGGPNPQIGWLAKTGSLRLSRPSEELLDTDSPLEFDWSPFIG
ncbi:hypothetical protein L0F63_007354 [Massospora cicadina]|nr:hypothetical protein L0F63_007354 [Massospora cicadina]